MAITPPQMGVVFTEANAQWLAKQASGEKDLSRIVNAVIERERELAPPR